MSYNEKHNEANGEDNNDGESHNRSWNCGVEGPTDDPDVRSLRARQRRNFLATLLLSQGVPMLAHGDEIARTQRGNNNAYGRANALGGGDWGGVEGRAAERAALAALAELAVLTARPVLGAEPRAASMRGVAVAREAPLSCAAASYSAFGPAYCTRKGRSDCAAWRTGAARSSSEATTDGIRGCPSPGRPGVSVRYVCSHANSSCRSVGFACLPSRT